MIALSKTVDVGRDHLIHRKRSPFPYEGKALTRRKVGETYNAGQRGNASLAGYSKCRARQCKSRLNLDRAIVLPLEGKGDRSAVDEVNISPAPLRGASPLKYKKAPDKGSDASFIGRLY